METSRIELVYWDACIFLAWLRDEKRPNNEMDGVEWAVRRIMKGQLRILTCATTRQEIIATKIGDEAEKKFSAFLDHKFVNFKDIDYPTSKLAGEIEEYYRKNEKAGSNKGMTPKDAQHLASAIVHGVDAFHTFDEGNKGGLNLLGLDGNIAGYPLKICKPPLPSQRKLEI